MFSLAFLIIFSLIIPLSLIGFSFWFKSCTAADMDGMIGYNTPMSRKNEDIWVTAQRISGGVWFVFGIVSLAAAVIGIVIAVLTKANYDDASYNILLAVDFIQIVLLLVSIPIIERRLRRIFNCDGSRKR